MPLAFPEVFVDREQRGFDAMVGNPPFLGGKRISGALGSDFREFVVRWTAAGRTGSADLVTYFFLRAAHISTGFGFLATNSISPSLDPVGRTTGNPYTLEATRGYSHTARSFTAPAFFFSRPRRIISSQATLGIASCCSQIWWERISTQARITRRADM